MELSEARSLALELMDEFELEGWHFKLDQATRRFGRCIHRTRTIQISGPLTKVNDRYEVEDTIRHEIAHALVGPGAGHGPRWVAMCAVTGARPEQHYGPDVNKPAPTWYLVCPRCGYEEGRYRRPSARGYIHKRCGGMMLERRAT